MGATLRRRWSVLVCQLTLWHNSRLIPSDLSILSMNSTWTCRLVLFTLTETEDFLASAPFIYLFYLASVFAVPTPCEVVRLPAFRLCAREREEALHSRDVYSCGGDVENCGWYAPVCIGGVGKALWFASWSVCMRPGTFNQPPREWFCWDKGGDEGRK